MKKTSRSSYIEHRNITEDSSVQRTMLVPDHIIDRMIRSFYPYWKRQKEAIAYWFGKEINSENTDVVLTLVIPKAIHTPGHYEVSMDETTRMGNKMLESGMICLAQVHTHPEGVAFHSKYDDLHSLSQRNGFLSLVVQNYGKVPIFNLEGINVHEFFEGSWRILGKEQKLWRIKIINDFVDLRIDDT